MMKMEKKLLRDAMRHNETTQLPQTQNDYKETQQDHNIPTKTCRQMHNNYTPLRRRNNDKVIRNFQKKVQFFLEISKLKHKCNTKTHRLQKDAKQPEKTTYGYNICKWLQKGVQQLKIVTKCLKRYKKTSKTHHFLSVWLFG